MLPNKRWVVLALALSATLTYQLSRRRQLAQLVDNLRRYSAPSATLYDAVASPVLAGFYEGVAKDLAQMAPGSRVLEIGSGPGRLAVKLAELAPGVQVIGVDISPEMVEKANALALRSGVLDRAQFRVGDVAALPFSDASFDAVVSTLSLHHWANPANGLTEIHRVLRPGGVARIYDVVDWIRQFEQRGPGIQELVRDSSFEEDGTCSVRITSRLGPVPLVYRADLRRVDPGRSRPDLSTSSPV